MKKKSKTLAKWFPPQTAQKGDGDCKDYDDDAIGEAGDHEKVGNSQ